MLLSDSSFLIFKIPSTEFLPQKNIIKKIIIKINNKKRNTQKTKLSSISFELKTLLAHFKALILETSFPSVLSYIKV